MHDLGSPEEVVGRQRGSRPVCFFNSVVGVYSYTVYERCIKHSIHLMVCHFMTALNVPGLGRTKAKLHASSSGQQVVDEFDKGLDIDTSMEIEASADDAEAMHAAFDITFEAGNVVGKLMAFIAQLRSCGDDTRDYLKRIATSLGCLSWEIKLWICTCWGSLSDCFRTVLAIQKVCRASFFYDLLAHDFGCFRLLTSSVALLMVMKTYRPLQTERNGPTTYFLEQSGGSSNLHKIVWRYVSCSVFSTFWISYIDLEKRAWWTLCRESTYML